LNIKIKIIILLALIPLIIFLWPEALGGDTQFLLVQGTSMLGTIEPGSFVILKEKEKYEVDDIVGYSTAVDGPFSGRNVVHRIMEEKRTGFILKGDNNPKIDPGIVREDQIFGEVIFFTPFAGYLLIFMRNPLVMGVLAVAVMMMQFGRKKKKKPKLEVEQKPKKKRKLDYVLFAPALVINLVAYVVIQVSFEAGIDFPQADPLTTFLYSISDVYFASTISFALYFLLILGSYYFAKTRDSIPRKLLSSGRVLTLEKKTNYFLSLARLIWLILIISGIYFLYLMLQDLNAKIGIY
jgi:signal peptidase I